VRKTIEYWKYELCFEAEVSQSHGPRQSLGHYVGLDGPVQVYEDGSECVSRHGTLRRKSRVEFVCDRQLRVRSVDEVATCSYRFVVGTPVVCGSPEFGVAPSDDQDVVAGETPRELWHLEFVEMDDGRVACAARAVNSDTRARSDRQLALTVLHFSSFQLEVSGAGLSPTALDDAAAGDGSRLRLAHDAHVCRAPDRVRLSAHEREYALVSDAHQQFTVGGGARAASPEASHSVALRSGDAFAGQLEYAYLQLRVG